MTEATDTRIRSSYEEDPLVFKGIYKKFLQLMDAVRPNRTSGQEKVFWQMWMAGFRAGQEATQAEERGR